MSELDIMLQGHEERLARSEQVVSGVAAQMAAMSEQLKAVGDKVEAVGVYLRKDIAEFRARNDQEHSDIQTEVRELTQRSNEHSENLALLLSDRQRSHARLATLRKLGSAALVAFLGAIATLWGDALFHWLFKVK